jgi:ribonuclease G
MGEEILINVAPRETRVAVVEQRLLQQIFVERSYSRGIVGNIYKSKVVRILPGLQSAFVDIGQAKAGFLHVTDLIDLRISADEGLQNRDLPRIETLIREGQSLLVQVTKEPIGTKGARVTTNLSLASRYLVYMPGSTHIGISQKIEDEAGREELRRMIELFADAGIKDGFIARTAAEMAQPAEICREAELLRQFWRSVSKKSKSITAPAIVFEDLPLHLKVVRDLIHHDTTSIIVDSAALFDQLSPFLQDFVPQKSDCLLIVMT